ncbi:P-loop containing nucleoside triphosphate hydrolases superfamily protein [Theobroma cacao]|uniref:P-loop containing nucleoside triphosphate hydrolases superfamily protein n=1 Tax=Theobroma cacao TaxID=3641 RepID=A0A061EA02_THECC|nr:P-loop containing nucleoside triphosphate hydrolases superfamily protein [Theobroma cacao]
MGGECSSKDRVVTKKTLGFIDAVFSWSLEDIFNDNLYKDQVEKIPVSFQSTEHYLGSYVLPLLEETRAAIRSAMESIARAPYAEVTYLNEAKPHGTLSFDVNVDYWRNRTVLFREDVVSEEVEELFLLSTDVKLLRQNAETSLLLCSVRSQCLSVLKALRDSLQELKLPSARNKDSIIRFCFQTASLLFSTACGSHKLYKLEMKPLNVLVIDEAAQLKECESAIPLQLPGIAHSFLIGDEWQLPATVLSNVSDEAGFGRSLFQRLTTLGHSKHLLNIQYRMHPSISCFPNARFYSNQILDAPCVKHRSYEKHYLPWPMFGPYSFINVCGREEVVDAGYSHRNMVELAVVQRLVRTLYKAWNGSREKLSVGIISPYAAQVVAIQEKLGGKYEKIDGFVVKVKTVDGHSLWILGNGETLAKSESAWEALVHDAKARSCFYNADKDKELAKATLDAKKALNQLDDLRNGHSALLKSARWKVLFSDCFRMSLGKLKSVQTKKLVLNLLLKLSSGCRPKKRKVDLISESSGRNMTKSAIQVNSELSDHQLNEQARRRNKHKEARNDGAGSLKMGDAIAFVRGERKNLRRKEKRARIEQIKANLGLSDSQRTPMP